MPPWAPLNAAPTSRLLAGPAGTPGFPSLHCAARRRPCAPSGHCPRAWQPVVFLERSNTSCRLPARLRAGGPGSEWAAPSSAGRAAARASALRELTRGSCLSGASAARAASSAAGRGTEQRRGVGAQRRPPTAERTGPPARSLARADATTVNASQATRHALDGLVMSRVSIQTDDFDLSAEVAALRTRARRRRRRELRRHRARPQRRRARDRDGARALPRHDRARDRGDDRRGAAPLRHPRARA